ITMIKRTQQICRMISIIRLGKSEVYAAERSAIKNERPRWNIKDNPCPSSQTPDTKPSPKPSSLASVPQTSTQLEAMPIMPQDIAKRMKKKPVNQPKSQHAIY